MTPGFSLDGDCTAVALRVLAVYGRPQRPDALLAFHCGDHFACYIGESTPSTSTNAHILDTLTDHVTRHPHDHARYEQARRMATDWLLGQQQSTGEWHDKWHASEVYATACCALALAADGTPAARRAVTQAVDWVLSTQRADGGWGRWRSTVEETAYAVQILTLTPRTEADDAARAAAVRKSQAILNSSPRHTVPLWHAKDLYAPARVIEAARLGALYLSLPYTERCDLNY